MSTPIENKMLVLRDELHGDIRFDGLVRQVIDHRLFQRLRHIKQMGLADYVFPCATHTRFQHSLGVGYLAGEYFASVIANWTRSPLRGESRSGDSRVFFSQTRDRVVEVAEDPGSLDFWGRVTLLGGLLHDVGHGPWSHTFERIELSQDFRSGIAPLKGAVRTYFEDLLAQGQRLAHEDVSVLHVFRIFQDLDAQGRFPHAARYFLPVASLINKKLVGFGGAKLEAELTAELDAVGVKGGVDFHRLMRPIVSGPFDADRIDYIQRDGRNCGVSIGGVEWRRIVAKVLPCLGEFSGDDGEPSDVVLLSSVKNQHVLDDFVFSLFQMYAQVYMHPKIVGIEEEVQRVLRERVTKGIDFKVTIETHETLDDARFLRMMEERYGLTQLSSLLSRQEADLFQVASIPDGFISDGALAEKGFSSLEVHERPMLKDSLGVFLFSNFEVGPNAVLRPWSDVSPVVRCLASVSYHPNYWMRRAEMK